jgi:HAD superfamily hydrolase (TIGR01509 family)
VLSESGKKGYIRSILAGLYGIAEADLDSDDLQASWRRNLVDEDQVLGVLNAFYGKKVTKEMFYERAHKTTVRSLPVYDLAEKLRAAGIKTGILSNIFSSTARELKEKGFYDNFDPIILSCQEGYAKPDPEFYAIAVQKSGVTAEEILFIDDQEKCRPPAEKIGMHFLLAESPEQIVQDTTAIIAKYNNLIL